MKHLRIWRTLLLALSAVGLAGCAADSVMAPPKVQAGASEGLVGDLLGGLFTKNVLERKTALTKDITVTATIDDRGGVITIPAAGFQLTVPAGAVQSRTKFTVTALKGYLVAYEFGPHGITFASALTARQDLSVTQWRADLRPLTAGYFSEKSALDDGSATALVSELINGVINPLSKQFSFGIEHFSGYVVAW